MSPKGRTISRRSRNSLIGGGAGLVGAAVVALIAIAQSGGGEDLTPPHGGIGDTGDVIRIDLLASRDLGALPSRDTWCAGSDHCWLFQQSSGDATDYGDTGGWHLSPSGSPRAGVVSGLPVSDTTGRVDTSTEAGVWFDFDVANYYNKLSVPTMGASTELVSVTMVFNTTPSTATQRPILHGGGVGWATLIDSAGILRGYGDGATAQKYVYSTTTVDDGAWHCATVVMDGRTADAGRIYLDGVDDTAATRDMSGTGGWSQTAEIIVGKFISAIQPMVGGLARIRIDYAGTTLADHQAHCGTLWQAPAGGESDNLPLAADDSWTQTGGAVCYPTSSTTATCQPGGVPHYTVDATGLGWVTEPSATNRILYSTAIDCTNWTCTGTASATPLQLAPDGSATASIITVPDVSNSVYSTAAGYTASAALHPGVWVKCSAGTLGLRNPLGSTAGLWLITCATASNGSWTLIKSATQTGVVQSYAFAASVPGSAGIQFYGSGGTVTASIWAPTLTEEPGTGLAVIPTGAAAVSTGDPAWTIDNTSGSYYVAGDTVTQTLSQITGTCWVVSGTDLLLSGAAGSECSGVWYGLNVAP